MHLISIDQVKIPERQRKAHSMEAIARLTESIRTKGLMHPIVLRNDTDTLVAGEGRVQAIKQLEEVGGLGVKYFHNECRLNCKTIPFVRLRELSTDMLFEAELEENDVREQLSLQDRMSAIATLHKIRKLQDPAQTEEATAQEMLKHAGGGVSTQRQLLSDALLISKHEELPEVQKAKSRRDAIRAIRIHKEAERKVELAEQFKEVESPIKLVLGDCLEVLPTLEDESIDILITDPPYGIGADKFIGQAKVPLKHKYDDSRESWVQLLGRFANLVTPKCKPDAHAYIFCSFENFAYLSNLFLLGGWNVWPRPIIWSKGNRGIAPVPDQGPRYTYECILFAKMSRWRSGLGNGRRALSRADVINCPIGQLIFAAEKPAELYLELLSRSAKPGDFVVDPFAGFGPLIDAAKGLALRALLVEQDKEKFGHMMRRLD